MSKNFRIEPVEASTMVRIAYVGGGEVPDALKGMFTNATIAKQHLAAWAAANPEREVGEPEVVPRGNETTARAKPKQMSSL